MSARTPGPWFAGPVTNALGYYQCFVSAGTAAGVTIAKSYSDDRAAAQGNANMMAAAPDMHSALRAAVAAAQPLPAPLGPPLTEHVDVWPQWVIDARAALAKAEA